MVPVAFDFFSWAFSSIYASLIAEESLGTSVSIVMEVNPARVPRITCWDREYMDIDPCELALSIQLLYVQKTS